MTDKNRKEGEKSKAIQLGDVEASGFGAQMRGF
jgi:hypothetical protein